MSNVRYLPILPALKPVAPPITLATTGATGHGERLVELRRTADGSPRLHVSWRPNHGVGTTVVFQPDELEALEKAIATARAILALAGELK